MKHIPIIVPDGQSGDWRVETFQVPPREASFANMRASCGRPLEAVESGTYKRLVRGCTTVMSNTPMELSTNRPIIRAATGNVLINGLGLGMVLSAILDKIDHVTVIEKSPDVIKLVGPSFVDPRITIIEADAYTWEPPKGVRYNAVWHDIWDNICGDNTKGMGKLHRKYGRRTDWQDSWCKAECQEANRRWRSSSIYHHFHRAS